MSTTVVVGGIIAAGLVFGAVGVFIGHKYARLKQKCDPGDCMRHEEEIQDDNRSLLHISIKDKANASLFKRPLKGPAELESIAVLSPQNPPAQNFL